MSPGLSRITSLPPVPLSTMQPWNKPQTEPATYTALGLSRQVSGCLGKLGVAFEKELKPHMLIKQAIQKPQSVPMMKL